MSLLSICSQLFVISAVYVLGRLNYSAGWIIPLLISTVRDYTVRKREIKRAVMDARRSMRERDNVTSRFASFEEIPSWVMFPDVERAEWINTIVKLYWPKINNMVESALRDIQPKIIEQSHFKGFLFTKFDLGLNVRLKTNPEEAIY